MKAEIIAVGSELLTPFFVDTNSAFLAERMDEMGIRISFRTIVGDDETDLRRAARTALGRSGIVLVTGGLGPTEDDRTREVFSEVLGRRLIFKKSIKRNLEDRFGRRGLSVPSTNLKQCRVIEGAEVLDNVNGTAPGLWLETGRKVLVLMPGPPKEMGPLFDSLVGPRLAAVLGRPKCVFRRVFKLTGLGESAMEEKILSIYPALPRGASITTLAKPGDLSIIITVTGAPDQRAAEKRIRGTEDDLMDMVGNWVYSREGLGLEAVDAALLGRAGLTVACAESCTGGLLSDRLTSVPGSSSYFLGSTVSYSNASKTRLLGVPAGLINRHGAVSREVAAAMARAIMVKAGSDIGLATTGIAGPGGGTAEKPVGLVFTAIADRSGTLVERNLFGGDRETNKFMTVQKCLDMLRRRLVPGARDERRKTTGKNAGTE